jgi:hypothetical protein
LESSHEQTGQAVARRAAETRSLYCQLTIIAKGDAVIRENTIELGIKESLSQRDIEADFETG